MSLRNATNLIAYESWDERGTVGGSSWIPLRAFAFTSLSIFWIGLKQHKKTSKIMSPKTISFHFATPSLLDQYL